MIASCPPLDTNSAYCNLLQCTHFAETCVFAEQAGRLVGWISAYRPPTDPEKIFVWQVAVAPTARNTGLGGRMLDALLARPTMMDITRLETTITADNAGSWALFTSFARRHGAFITQRSMFDRNAHFAGLHETELLVSISPLAAGS